MRICSRCASRAEPFPGPLGAIGTSNHSVSGADETPRAFNENIPVGVLLEPEERYVGLRTAVVEHVANHLRSFDIAVMGQDSGVLKYADGTPWEWMKSRKPCWSACTGAAVATEAAKAAKLPAATLIISDLPQKLAMCAHRSLVGLAADRGFGETGPTSISPPWGPGKVGGMPLRDTVESATEADPTSLRSDERASLRAVMCRAGFTLVA